MQNLTQKNTSKRTCLYWNSENSSQKNKCLFEKLFVLLIERFCILVSAFPAFMLYFHLLLTSQFMFSFVVNFEIIITFYFTAFPKTLCRARKALESFSAKYLSVSFTAATISTTVLNIGLFCSLWTELSNQDLKHLNLASLLFDKQF